MRAIVICAGRNAALLNLDEHTPAELLMLADRPLLQHVVEYFVHQGVRDIDLILNHLPEQVEAYAGDGTRWGCRIRYHLVAGHDQSWKALRVICAGLDDDIALASAEHFPGVAWTMESNPPAVLLKPENEDPAWWGWAAFHSSKVKELFAGDTLAEITERLNTAIGTGMAKAQPVDTWISVSTPAEILASQKMLLEGRAATMQLTGTQVEKGAWIGRNSSIHPTAILVPPFYLGPNTRIGARTRIGPFAVIGDKCIVDEDSVVEDSMVTPGTYVGQGLELQQAILDRNRLVNARLETEYLISEAFIAGGLAPVKRMQPVRQAANRLLALLLLILFSPLVVALLIAVLLSAKLRLRYVPFVYTSGTESSTEGIPARYLRVELPGPANNLTTPWSHFAFRFLPGLFSALAGSIGICGVPARSAEELRELPSDWRAICLQCAPGLVSEEIVVCGPEASSEERYSADAYYFARKSFVYDLALLLRYFERLLPHAPRQLSGASTRTEEQSL